MGFNYYATRDLGVKNTPTSYQWLTGTLAYLDRLHLDYKEQTAEAARRHEAEISRLEDDCRLQETVVQAEIERCLKSHQTREYAAEELLHRKGLELAEEVAQIEQAVRQALHDRRTTAFRHRELVDNFASNLDDLTKRSDRELIRLTGRAVARPLMAEAASVADAERGVNVRMISDELAALSKIRDSLDGLAPAQTPGFPSGATLALVGVSGVCAGATAYVTLGDVPLSGLLALSVFGIFGRLGQLGQRARLLRVARELHTRIEALRLSLAQIERIEDADCDREEKTAEAKLRSNQLALAERMAELRRARRVEVESSSLRFSEENARAAASLRYVQEEHARDRAREEQRAAQAASAFKTHFATSLSDAVKTIDDFAVAAGFAALPWTAASWQAWQPAERASLSIMFGGFQIPCPAQPEKLPGAPGQFFVPALHDFSLGRMFLATPENDRARADAISLVQSVALRLLANVPPGKLRFLLIDPVGLGQNVAPLMPLADHDDILITSKAWTSEQHIEQRLAEMGEHIEVVIQKYLRTDYESIHDYNSDAEEVAEPYRVLVIFDFPWGFSSKAAETLVSIVQNGPRCGVFTLLVFDPTKTPPHGFRNEDILREATTVIVGRRSALSGQHVARVLTLDVAPPTEFASLIVRRVGEAAKAGRKVEVTFEKLRRLAELAEDPLWTQSSARGVTVPLGVRGARKTQLITIGEGTAHHGLVVGRTGSGKTNLFNVLITNVALNYSPSEVRLYLIDFKGGVSFKPYAKHQLPHAVAIAVESEREFGLSVLERVEEEMKHRADLFRSNHVKDLTDYRARGIAPLPRVIVVVDEFQLLFAEEDSIAQRARQAIEYIVRQGRGYGIHLLLGSQNLAGSAALSSAITDQMAIRVALQCSDADARMIMAHDNPAARTLSRDGEAIYNSAAGLIEGNSPFQAAHLPDEPLQAALQRITATAQHRGVTESPVVFEGDRPGRLENCAALWSRSISPRGDAPLWLGEATAIRPPVHVTLRRQSGRNLLVVDREEAQGAGVLFASWLSLLRAHAPNEATFHVLDLNTAESGFSSLICTIGERFPHRFFLLNRRTLPSFLEAANAEITERLEHSSSQSDSVYFLIFGLQRARDLKPDRDSLSLGEVADLPKLFATMLRDGPEAGYHTLACAEPAAGASRIVEGSLREFGVRVAGSMSHEDSQTIVEDSAAARLTRSFRAVVYDEEQAGRITKILPFAPPSPQDIVRLASQPFVIPA